MCTQWLESVKSLLESWLVDRMRIRILKRSKKIFNGFVFPEMEDLASIARKDIEMVLPPPCAAAQTERFCLVLKFDSDLSFVYLRVMSLHRFSLFLFMKRIGAAVMYLKLLWLIATFSAVF